MTNPSKHSGSCTVELMVFVLSKPIPVRLSLRSRSRSTVRRPIRNDRRSNGGAARAIRAVPQSIAKVRILAQARRIRTRAAQRLILSLHVVEARLATRGQGGEARRCGAVCCERRRAVCAAVSDHGARHCCSAGAVCAVAKPVPEVDIVAQAV